MSKEFNPAPRDKHADDPKQAVQADKQHKKLEKALRIPYRHLIRSAKLNPSRRRIHLLRAANPAL